MTGDPPLAPPPPPPDRKGLSPLAWTGIGCGALAIIGIVALAFAIGWGVNKVKSLASQLEDFANDPVALVEFVAEHTSEIEIVEKNDANETITIRNTESGQEVTLSYQDIQEGKFSFVNADGEFNFDFANQDGSISVETPHGKTTVGGTVDLTGVPPWVPVYPGSVAVASSVTTKPDKGDKGHLVMTSQDAIVPVQTWFETELETNQLTPQIKRVAAGAVISGKSASGTRGVEVSLSPVENGTTITISYTE